MLVPLLRVQQDKDDDMPFGRGGPVTDYKNDVGPGWAGLLDQLDAELREIDPNYQTIQVKEKFGDLRVYIEGTPIQADIITLGVGRENLRMEGTATGESWRRLQDVVDKYENLSASICEECGAPGTKDNSHYWIKTLCAACSVARNEGRRRTWAKAEESLVEDLMREGKDDRRAVQGDLDSGEQQGS